MPPESGIPWTKVAKESEGRRSSGLWRFDEAVRTAVASVMTPPGLLDAIGMPVAPGDVEHADRGIRGPQEAMCCECCVLPYGSVSKGREGLLRP